MEGVEEFNHELGNLSEGPVGLFLHAQHGLQEVDGEWLEAESLLAESGLDKGRIPDGICLAAEHGQRSNGSPSLVAAPWCQPAGSMSWGFGFTAYCRFV